MRDLRGGALGRGHLVPALAVPLQDALVRLALVPRTALPPPPSWDVNATVPEASGNVIVLSAVGFVTVNVVSYSSADEPSNRISLLVGIIIPVLSRFIALDTKPFPDCSQNCI